MRKIPIKKVYDVCQKVRKCNTKIFIRDSNFRILFLMSQLKLIEKLFFQSTVGQKYPSP